MSKFTFEGDKLGTLTPEMLTLAEKKAELGAISAPTTAQTDMLVALNALDPTDGTMYAAEVGQGQDGDSFDGLARKEFFNKLKMKGLQACGDIVMQDGADIHLLKDDGVSDSSDPAYDADKHLSMRSLIKKVEVVFGYEDGGGVFQSADPALEYIADDANFANNSAIPADATSDSVYNSEAPDQIAATAALANADKKWFLRLTKVDGSVSHSEFDAVNDVLGQVDGDSATTLSILEAMKDINDVQDALRVLFLDEGAARQADVNALETKIRTDLLALALHLNDMEQKMITYVHEQDEAVHAYILDRMEELAEDINGAESMIKFHGEIAASSAASLSFQSASALHADVDGDIANWSIDVAAINPSDVRLDDFEPAWEAEIDGDGKLNITISQLACEASDLVSDGVSQFDWVVNAVFCGDIPSGTINPDRDSAEEPASYTDNKNNGDVQPAGWYDSSRDLIIAGADDTSGVRTDTLIDDDSTP